MLKKTTMTAALLLSAIAFSASADNQTTVTFKASIVNGSCLNSGSEVKCVKFGQEDKTINIDKMIKNKQKEVDIGRTYVSIEEIAGRNYMVKTVEN